MNFPQKKVASGFLHSVAIGENDSLFYWGDNYLDNDKRERGFPQYASEPHQVRLLEEGSTDFTGRPHHEQNFEIKDEKEYHAIDVACGPQSTFVIGRQQLQTFINIEDKDAQNVCKGIYENILNKKGQSLQRFFELHRIKKQSSKNPCREQYEMVKNQVFGAKRDDEEEILKVLEEMSPYELYVEKDVFKKRIKDASWKDCKEPGIKSLQGAIPKLKVSHHRRTQEHRQKAQNLADYLFLGDIEDFALGFLQHNTKLFVFGSIPSAILGEEEEEEHEKNKRIAHRQRNTLKVDVPRCIQFDQFTKPIVSVAAGSEHVMVLTLSYELFVWGEGGSGQLGLGGNNDYVTKPTRLIILDHLKEQFKIVKIACGRFHSMCLTNSYNLFSWGEGTQGRLGLGTISSDQPEPKMIYDLSQRKPIEISAGESHSAAVTSAGQLYTWGNGGFGRLGLQNEKKMEDTPKLVEDVPPIVYVSCGAYHTLAISEKGHVFSFGQNKYGKLGIHESKAADLDVTEEPKRIAMYHKKNEQPIKVKEEVFQVSAGMNHSLSVGYSGHCYSWGYHGKGILGRHPESTGVALPIGKNHPYLLKTEDDYIEENTKKDKKKKDDEDDESFKGANLKEIKISSVALGSVNTIVLTNKGEVYVSGDNTFNQHGISVLEDQGNASEQKQFGKFSFPTKIPFPEKINLVACGNYHMFAKTELDEVYGWGRSDEGQLGIGYLSDKVEKPTIIEPLCNQGIKQIVCGDNYSAALTIFGKILVAGSLDGGKLGLGKGQRRGYKLEFSRIEHDAEFNYIAGGVFHMLAISRTLKGDTSGLSGKTYAWGNNSKGQLGVTSTENRYEPTLIKNAKEKFEKVACGANYSLGLTSTNKLYFWGNFRYNTGSKIKEHVYDPILLDKLANKNIVDVSACYKSVFIRTDKGELFTWGRFLAQPKPHKVKKKKKRLNDIEIHMFERFFPREGSSNRKMESVITGANHAAGFADDQKLYVWGYNTIHNRMACKEVKLYKEPVEPRAIYETFLREQFDDQKGDQINPLAQPAEENEQEDQQDQDDESVDPEEIEMEEKKASEVGTVIESLSGDQSENTDGGEQQLLQGGTVGFAATRQDDRSKMSKRGGGTTPQVQSNDQGSKSMAGFDKKFKDAIIMDEVVSFNNQEVIQNKVKQDSKKTLKSVKALKFADHLALFDQRTQLPLLNFIRQFIHKKEQPQIKNFQSDNKAVIDPIQDVLKPNSQLQLALINEDKNGLDKKSILELDNVLADTVSSLIKEVYCFSKYQIEYKEFMNKGKQYMAARIEDYPFSQNVADNQIRIKYQGRPEKYIEVKQHIQQFFTYLQLHPCYMVKFLQSDLFSFDQKKLLVKQLYHSTADGEKNRLNNLLITVFKLILPKEIEDYIQEFYNNNEDGALTDKFEFKFGKECQLISIYIFKRIFQTQETNMDSICAILCHIINIIMNKYSNGEGKADNSLDLLEEVIEENKDDNKKEKKGGTAVLKAKAEALAFDILELIMKDIVQNNIVKDLAQTLTLKKGMKDQQDYIKQQLTIYKDNPPQNKNNNQKKKDHEPQEIKLGGIDIRNQLREYIPTFRFSEDVYFMISTLHDELKKHESQVNNDHLHYKILGLIFEPQIDRIMKCKELYFYPYLSKIRMREIIRLNLEDIHKVNFKNVLECFRGMITGQQVFTQKNSGFIADLNKNIKEIHNKYKDIILKNILKSAREITSILPYRHFENQLLHSLDPEDSRRSNYKLKRTMM